MDPVCDIQYGTCVVWRLIFPKMFKQYFLKLINQNIKYEIETKNDVKDKIQNLRTREVYEDTEMGFKRP